MMNLVVIIDFVGRRRHVRDGVKPVASLTNAIRLRVFILGGCLVALAERATGLLVVHVADYNLVHFVRLGDVVLDGPSHLLQV